MRRLLVLVPLLVLAGCAKPGSDAGGPGPAPGQGQSFSARAQVVADAWRAAGVGEAWRTGFVPLQELTIPPDSGFTDETKQAYMAGWYVAGTALGKDKPADGTVRFADGTSLSAPLTSADEAYRAIDQGDPPCPSAPLTPPPPSTPSAGPDGAVGHPAPGGCTALTVTGATLGTATIRTSRGEATVPVWQFTVAGLPKPVSRIAVAPSSIAALPEPKVPPFASPGEVVAAQDLAKVDGATVTYRIVIGACDKNPRPLVYETDDVVVLGGAVDRSTAGVCIEMAKFEPVTTTLRKPLGTRVVLDVNSGRPLTINAGQ